MAHWGFGNGCIRCWNADEIKRSNLIKLDDRVILISGAASGIGRACALRLARRGFTVFAGVRRAEDGEALLNEVAGDLRPVRLDVADAESIEAAVAAIGDRPLSGLVNNAGVVVTGPLELLPMDALRRQFDVNVLGAVALTQAVLPKLRAAHGRIVNIGSIAGRLSLPGSGAYDASKSALAAISDAMRMELRASGIAVSLIEPGAVATPIWSKIREASEDLRQSTPPERFAPYAALMDGLEREGAHSVRTAVSADTVAKAVEHAMTAASPRARYLVGADTLLWLALGLLPDRWRDWLILGKLLEASPRKPD